MQLAYVQQLRNNGIVSLAEQTAPRTNFPGEVFRADSCGCCQKCLVTLVSTKARKLHFFQRNVLYGGLCSLAWSTPDIIPFVRALTLTQLVPGPAPDPGELAKYTCHKRHSAAALAPPQWSQHSPAAAGTAGHPHFGPVDTSRNTQHGIQMLLSSG